VQLKRTAVKQYKGERAHSGRNREVYKLKINQNACRREEHRGKSK
jgi:hypothetical protein